jgi:stress-induced morphogen
VKVPTPDELKQRIEAAIPGAAADVHSADNVHFSAHVRSEAFAGKSRIQQHRMVYDVFDEGELGGAVHALQIKTEVP